MIGQRSMCTFREFDRYTNKQ